MTIVRQKLEENKKKIAQKNQRKNSWKSFEEKITPPSRDFGGGFREFRGQRFERRDDEKQQNFYERRESGMPSRSDGRRKFDDQRQQKFSDGSGGLTYKGNKTDYSTFSGRPSRFSRIAAAASSRKRVDDFDEIYDDEPRNRRSGRAPVDFDDADADDADLDSSDDRRFRRFRKADARMDDSLDVDFSLKSRSRIADDDEDFEVERRSVGRGRRRKNNKNDYDHD